MKALDSTKVQVGFFEGDKYEDTGIPVAQVAYFNEYGTHLNPTRPFMHDTFETDVVRRLIKHGLGKVFIAAVKGQAIQHTLRELGKKLVEAMQAHVDAYPGNNSAATILRKGFNDPLYDTGKMMKSVKFQIS
ncbi:hypothetical protein C0J26_11310 [Pseudomonas baetica]|nr:hypothetical protein C0J26_11310 [Pseudomonas baetica]